MLGIRRIDLLKWKFSKIFFLKSICIVFYGTGNDSSSLTHKRDY